jgi:hypothetical protein
MIDIEDLLLLAGIVLLLVVAFHFGLWAGLGTLAIALIITGLALGKLKAYSKPYSKPKGKI